MYEKGQRLQTQTGVCSCVCLYKVQVSWAGSPDGYKCGLAT